MRRHLNKERDGGKLIYPHGKQEKLRKRRIRAMRTMLKAEEALREILEVRTP